MAAPGRRLRRSARLCLTVSLCFLATNLPARGDDGARQAEAARNVELRRKLEVEFEARALREARLRKAGVQERERLGADDFDDIADEPIAKRVDDPLATPGRITSQFRNYAFGTQITRLTDNLSFRLNQILETKVLAVHLLCGLTDAQKQKVSLAGQGDIQRLLDRIERQLAACQLLDQQGVNEIPNEFVNSALVLRATIDSGPFNEQSIFMKTLNNSMTAQQQGDYEAYRNLERLGGKVHLRSRGLRELQTIRMTDAAFTDAGSVHLRRLTKLEGLILDYTQVSDAGLPNLADLTRLELLDLGGTQVTGTGLRHLRNMQHLQWLDLRRTPLTDAGLAELRPLTGLRALHLEYTQITGTGFENLASLTILETLQLIQTRFSDASVAHLRNFQKLKVLSLEGTKITDDGVRHLSGLSQLESLDLRRAAVTDAGLVHLAGLARLQSLYLFGTQVTDEGVSKLKRALPELRVTR
jgi:Leucine rich repeat